MSQPKKSLVFAFGFDSLGFVAPGEFETDSAIIRFIGVQSDIDLQDADGLIIPSGLFEKFRKEHNPLGESYWVVECARDEMARREKQMNLARKNGAWVAFLLQDVDNGRENRWSDTDLAKRYVNVFFKNVVAVDPDPHVPCKSDEFRQYLDRYGIARTCLRWPRDFAQVRILAGDEDATFAAEVGGNFFFLPLPSVSRDRNESVRIASSVSEAVIEYKRRNQIYLPAAIAALRFKGEAETEQQIAKLQTDLVKLEESLELWHEYKAILCTSGNLLTRSVVKVLRTFFGLSTSDEDRFVEDAAILDSNQQPLFIVEVKGVNGGLRREHINQVDSHRDRLQISTQTLDLLMINDFMDVEDLSERKAKQFHTDHLARAQQDNVRILRTTTLFDMMLAFEGRTDRAPLFLKACTDAAPLVELPKT
ncbi:MAG TPA: hypothetical protein VK846_15480 [Candidatus Limnocylindria bacterium]|nr:hypothetical protein [Candidatus Limnocylindria bacterium]